LRLRRPDKPVVRATQVNQPGGHDTVSALRGAEPCPGPSPFDAAQGYLRELVEGMVPGEELALTAGGEPIAIVTRPPRRSWPCQPGLAKDTKHSMSPDFDAPLDDFQDAVE
jgi:hypothetical protein